MKYQGKRNIVIIWILAISTMYWIPHVEFYSTFQSNIVHLESFFFSLEKAHEANL